MAEKNIISLSYDDNADLKDYLEGKKMGDRCSITVEGVLREVDGRMLVADIDEVKDVKTLETETEDEEMGEEEGGAMGDVIRENESGM